MVLAHRKTVLVLIILSTSAEKWATATLTFLVNVVAIVNIANAQARV